MRLPIATRCSTLQIGAAECLAVREGRHPAIAKITVRGAILSASAEFQGTQAKAARRPYGVCATHIRRMPNARIPTNGHDTARHFDRLMTPYIARAVKRDRNGYAKTAHLANHVGINRQWAAKFLSTIANHRDSPIECKQFGNLGWAVRFKASFLQDKDAAHRMAKRVVLARSCDDLLTRFLGESVYQAATTGDLNSLARQGAFVAPGMTRAAMNDDALVQAVLERMESLGAPTDSNERSE